MAANDRTLEIFLTAPSHVMQGDKEARRYRQYDVFHVYPSDDVTYEQGGDLFMLEPISSPHMCFLHLPNIPAGQLPRLDNAELPVGHIDSSGPIPFWVTTIRRNGYLDWSGLSPAEQDTLLTEKELTMQWNQADKVLFSKT